MSQLDLTPVTRAEMKIDRLELGDAAVVHFLQEDDIAGGYKPAILTLTQDDDWSLTDINNLYIKVDFLYFQVLDYDGFEDILDETDAIGFEGIIFKLERVGRPIGLNRVWKFKLEPVTTFPVTIT